MLVNVEALLASEELELPDGMRMSRLEATSQFREGGPSDMVFEVCYKLYIFKLARILIEGTGTIFFPEIVSDINHTSFSP